MVAASRSGPSAGTKTIRAKRSGVSAKRLKERHEAGEDVSDQRALIRMGPANTAILIGADDLSDWDSEELRHGQRRDKNGRFQGKAPKVVPKACYDELVKRTLSEAQQLFTDNIVVAVQALVDIVTSPMAEDKDKLRAIGMITDRAMGKAPERVEVTGTAKWELALRAGIVSVGNVADASLGFDEDEGDE
jgi:hypothetical protein